MILYRSGNLKDIRTKDLNLVYYHIIFNIKIISKLKIACCE